MIWLKAQSPYTSPISPPNPIYTLRGQILKRKKWPCLECEIFVILLIAIFIVHYSSCVYISLHYCGRKDRYLWSGYISYLSKMKIKYGSVWDCSGPGPGVWQCWQCCPGRGHCGHQPPSAHAQTEQPPPAGSLHPPPSSISSLFHRLDKKIFYILGKKYHKRF